RGAFFAAAGLAAALVGFLAAVLVFFAAVVFGAVLRARGAGAAARRSASSSAPRSGVIVATSSPLRSEALVSPSVTYGPNRPSLITIGLPVAGSLPSSRSGGAAAPRPRPRALGSASSAFAWSRETVNISSSVGSDRLSAPRLTY